MRQGEKLGECLQPICKREKEALICACVTCQKDSWSTLIHLNKPDLSDRVSTKEPPLVVTKVSVGMKLFGKDASRLQIRFHSFFLFLFCRRKICIHAIPDVHPVLGKLSSSYTLADRFYINFSSSILSQIKIMEMNTKELIYEWKATESFQWPCIW